MSMVLKFIVAMLLSSAVAANCEFGFSKDQEKLMRLAYATGYPDDLGYTLASIAWKESFVGKYIIRDNVKDGNYGSFGVTHVQLSTAMHMLGIKNSWQARQDLLPRMVTDDVFTLRLSLRYLKQHSDLPYRQMVSRYNGRGEMAEKYAEDVINRVHRLINCNYFKDMTRI